MQALVPVIDTSGDVLADRRYDYALALREAGNPVAAAELMRQALELVPGRAAGRFALGDIWHKLEQQERRRTPAAPAAPGGLSCRLRPARHYI